MPNFLVRNYAGKKVAKGGSVFVYGAGFTHSVKAWFDETQAVVFDCDDGYMEIMAGESAGSFTLKIGESLNDSVDVGVVYVLADVAELPVTGKIRHTVDELCVALLGLLPRGMSWYKGSDGVFYRLMKGFAYAVLEIYNLVELFVKESSPTHTGSFSEWEDELQLPEKGVVYSGTAADIAAKRRSEIYRKSCKKGGCSISFFKSIAALFGINANIYEYWLNPSEFSQITDDEDQKRFYWMIRSNSGMSGVIDLRCGNEKGEYQGEEFVCGNARSGMRLRSWGNPDFYAMIEKLKPAHTKCLYAYSQGA